MSKYGVDDTVWFISGTGSVLPARVKNVIITKTEYIEYTTYDLANDLEEMTEDKLFSSPEEAIKSIKE